MKVVTLALVILVTLTIAVYLVTRPSIVPAARSLGKEPAAGITATGEGPVMPAATVPPVVPSQRASRHREHLHTLHWHALALCESSGNPHAVSPSGKYRGAFQMDADFWRTYGGLQFAPRPDLASYEQQRIVAQHGFDARGRKPWPYCGRRL